MDYGFAGSCLIATLSGVVIWRLLRLIERLSATVMRLPYSIVEVDEKGVSHTIRLENRVVDLENFRREVEPPGKAMGPDWSAPGIDDDVDVDDPGTRVIE